MKIENISSLNQRKSATSWQHLEKRFQPKFEVVDDKRIYRFNYNYEEEKLVKRAFYMGIEPIGTTIPWHLHDYVELTIVVQGQVEIEFLNSSVILQTGEALLIDTRCAHRNHPENVGDVVITIAIRSELLKQLLVDGVPGHALVMRFLQQSLDRVTYSTRYWMFEKNDETILSGLLTALIGSYTHAQESGSNLQQALLQALLVLLMEQSHAKMIDDAHLNRYHVRPLDLILYIDEHYQQISLHEMADYFNYSDNYLSTWLKRSTGLSFQELVQQKRMDVAEELLKKTQLSVSQIAEQIGYARTAYFYRLFFRKTGLTPAEFRQRQ